MAYCKDHHTLITASADMTLLQWYLDDIPSIKHFTLKSRWPTKHAAMSMCWSSSHRLLYSGTTAGTIQGTVNLPVCRVLVPGPGHLYKIPEPTETRHTSETWVHFSFLLSGWDIGERQEMVTLKGHSDIVMGMMVMQGLDNLVSASLDTSIRVWDTYTQKPVQTLQGHNKV